VTHELTNHGDTLNNTFERLSLVVRKTSNGVILMDASGVIEWVNESFLRTTGFEFVDVVGRGFLSIIPSQGFDGRVAHRIEIDAAISQLNTESAAILTLRDATLALQRSLAEVRLMARGLLPPHLTQGLSVALGSMAAHMSIPDRLAVHFVDDFRADVADEIAEQIYRIAQEAVTNAARHGEATEVNVRLSATKRGIALRIADNGRGFPPNVCGAGTGILTMRYRAELLNGHISFETNGALGTIVCCVAPV
jgi:signal transduction histidine kinase